MKSMRKNKIIILLCVFVVIITLLQLRKVYFSSIIKKDLFFFINKKTTYNELLQKLRNEFNIPYYAAFSSFCNKKKLINFKPGKYLFDRGFSINDIINELRVSDNRETVNFSFNSFDNFENLASNLSQETNIDSAVFMNTIYSIDYDSFFNRSVDIKELSSFFIPNTYNIYWHISEDEFIYRMLKEYKNFWSGRKDKLKRINLSPFEVSILASIVEKESHNVNEMADIASLYLNRLNRNMKLQADPTVNFCFKMLYDHDTTLTRVSGEHLKIKCEYNTYLINGLPPGPITNPTIQSIDAVLLNKSTSHIYMCAKAKINEKQKKVCFFDSHIFAKTYFNHLKNARKYHKAMNKYENGYKVCFPNRENCICN